MEFREGEEEGMRFRSNRLFMVGAGYYFSTREKENVGPFDSKEAAEAGLKLFIDMITTQDATVEFAAKTALEGKWLKYIDF